MVRYAEEDKDLEKDKTDRGTNHVMLPSEMMYSFMLGFGFSLQGDPSHVSMPPFINFWISNACAAPTPPLFSEMPFEATHIKGFGWEWGLV